MGREHIDFPTHKFGGQLDVIITRSEFEIFNAHVDSLTVSDHGIISYSMAVAVSQISKLVYRRVRNNKSIDRDMFRSLLSGSAVCDSGAYLHCNVEELFDLYDSTLRQIVDQHAPLVNKRTSCSLREQLQPVSEVTNRNRLRSSDNGDLVIQKHKTSRFGKRRFLVSSAQI
ncbi:hypothetical protein HELRODRAFT_172655 [Helobdella robusta]|uniref:Uncharacterized protein n=1 Tax=Helobdella robusta TaxID=6412 RepID=T1F5Q7_HELRO|nr:hypothetical protein HELRODRAFT_172655 [Helobdella robusta]ESO04298.1 hypothetical protein HELRODRAFT_172655 [Helobdella robusta]